MTERRFRVGARSGGAVLAALAFLLMLAPELWATALAIELLAAAFWLWARAAGDAADQVPRWAWLRRPAMAMWLAFAVHVAFPALHFERAVHNPTLVMLSRVEAGAVMWAGLELLAALPLARPYSDVPGPLLGIRPWLPVVLPAAGFLLLWKHAEHGFGVPEVQRIALPLLLLTASLGALRAFARRNWTASLRWLAVSDSALAAVVVSLDAAPRLPILLLWLAASGAHAALLAGELKGAITRRGAAITRLWRAAGWIALGALSWPAVLAAGHAPIGGIELLYFLGAAVPVALIAWITVRRMVTAPERRMVVRPSSALALSQVGALAVIALSLAGLATAWWNGFEPALVDSAFAIAPALIGGVAAIAARQGHGRPFWGWVRGAGAVAPTVAGALFRLVTGLERRTVGVLARVARAAAAPLHDLHAGDAQEYLLFLAGLAVLALVAPLLR